MNNLPFVWELNYHGAISHLVGTSHLIADIYGNDASQKLEGKKKTLLEYAATPVEIDQYNKNRRKNLRLAILERLCIQSKYFPDSRGAQTYHRLVSMANQDRINLLDDMRIEDNRMLFGHDDPKALDIVIHEKSIGQGIPVLGLESQATIAEIKSWNYTSDNSFFEQKRYFDSYAAGDVRAFAAAFRHIERAWANSPESYGWKFNSRRNKEMADRSLEHLTEPCLIAVGIAHVIDFDPPLLKYLEEKGIKVKRI